MSAVPSKVARRCAACAQDKTKSDFSANQLAKPLLIGRCMVCVSGNVWGRVPHGRGNTIPGQPGGRALPGARHSSRERKRKEIWEPRPDSGSQRKVAAAAPTVAALASRRQTSAFAATVAAAGQRAAVAAPPVKPPPVALPCHVDAIVDFLREHHCARGYTAEELQGRGFVPDALADAYRLAPVARAGVGTKENPTRYAYRYEYRCDEPAVATAIHSIVDALERQSDSSADAPSYRAADDGSGYDTAGRKFFWVRRMAAAAPPPLVGGTAAAAADAIERHMAKLYDMMRNEWQEDFHSRHSAAVVVPPPRRSTERRRQPPGARGSYQYSIEQLRSMCRASVLVHQRISMWWPGDQSWYNGTVLRCDTGALFGRGVAVEIEFDDGDISVEALTKNIRLRLFKPPPRPPALQPAPSAKQQPLPVESGNAARRAVSKAARDAGQGKGAPSSGVSARLSNGEGWQNSDIRVGRQFQTALPRSQHSLLPSDFRRMGRVVQPRNSTEALMKAAPDLVMSTTMRHRFEAAIEQYGKDFRGVADFMNSFNDELGSEDSEPEVTATQLTIHYFSKFKHTPAHKAWHRRASRSLRPGLMMSMPGENGDNHERNSSSSRLSNRRRLIPRNGGANGSTTGKKAQKTKPRPSAASGRQSPVEIDFSSYGFPMPSVSAPDIPCGSVSVLVEPGATSRNASECAVVVDWLREHSHDAEGYSNREIKAHLSGYENNFVHGIFSVKSGPDCDKLVRYGAGKNGDPYRYRYKYIYEGVHPDVQLATLAMIDTIERQQKTEFPDMSDELPDENTIKSWDRACQAAMWSQRQAHWNRHAARSRGDGIATLQKSCRERFLSDIGTRAHLIDRLVRFEFCPSQLLGCELGEGSKLLPGLVVLPKTQAEFSTTSEFSGKVKSRGQRQLKRKDNCWSTSMKALELFRCSCEHVTATAVSPGERVRMLLGDGHWHGGVITSRNDLVVDIQFSDGAIKQSIPVSSSGLRVESISDFLCDVITFITHSLEQHSPTVDAKTRAIQKSSAAFPEPLTSLPTSLRCGSVDQLGLKLGGPLISFSDHDPEGQLPSKAELLSWDRNSQEALWKERQTFWSSAASSNGTVPVPHTNRLQSACRKRGLWPRGSESQLKDRLMRYEFFVRMRNEIRTEAGQCPKCKRHHGEYRRLWRPPFSMWHASANRNACEACASAANSNCGNGEGSNADGPLELVTINDDACTVQRLLRCRLSLEVAQRIVAARAVKPFTSARDLSEPIAIPLPPAHLASFNYSARAYICFRSKSCEGFG
eukprot:COSAG01_NODE_1221_length_11155_cov_13.069736_2_plen_1278_part_00